MYNTLFVRGQSFSVKIFDRSRSGCQVIGFWTGNDFHGPLGHRVQRRCVCRQNIKTCRKPLKKWVILIALRFRYTLYRPQTKRLRARKIGIQYKIRSGLIHFRHRVMRFTADEVEWYKFPPLSFLLLGTSCLGRPSGDVPCASEDMACGY